MSSPRATRQLLTLGLLVVVMGMISAVLISLNNRQRVFNSEQASSSANVDEASQSTTDSGEPALTSEDYAVGRYTSFDPQLIDDEGYQTNIIFFSADHDWCDECRAFERAIINQGVPDGVQILVADFENNPELKKQYQVTIQTTFVAVDDQGQRLSSWVGFAQDRSVDSILSGLEAKASDTL